MTLKTDLRASLKSLKLLQLFVAVNRGLVVLSTKLLSNPRFF